MCAYVYTHTAKKVNISYFQTAELGRLFTLYSPSLLLSASLLSPLLSSPLLILFLYPMLAWDSVNNTTQTQGIPPAPALPGL